MSELTQIYDDLIPALQSEVTTQLINSNILTQNTDTRQFLIELDNASPSLIKFNVGVILRRTQQKQIFSPYLLYDMLTAESKSRFRDGLREQSSVYRLINELIEIEYEEDIDLFLQDIQRHNVELVDLIYENQDMAEDIYHMRIDIDDIRRTIIQDLKLYHQLENTPRRTIRLPRRRQRSKSRRRSF